MGCAMAYTVLLWVGNCPPPPFPALLTDLDHARSQLVWFGCKLLYVTRPFCLPYALPSLFGIGYFLCCLPLLHG